LEPRLGAAGRVVFCGREIGKVFVPHDFAGKEEFDRGVAKIRYSKQMLELPPVGDDTWWQWLAARGFDDPSMSLQRLHLRYQRFHKVKFGMVPESEQAGYLHDLVPIEEGLVYGDAIGRVDEFPFKFRVEDPTPIRQRAIPYSRVER
jgi:hypothetical protein